MARNTAPILALVLASVGLHAAVLGVQWAGAVAPGPRAGAAVLARTVVLPPGASDSTGSATIKQLAGGAEPLLAAGPPIPPAQALAGELDALQTRLAVVPMPQALAPSEPETGPEDIYLPRASLSMPPVLRSALALPWPSSAQGGHFREIVALFIDELGVVQKVRVEGNGLPPELEAVARENFLGASFVPGELQGQPVKALIRVEVRFDAERPAGSRGARL